MIGLSHLHVTGHVKAMNFYRISDGKFVEEHGQFDLLGLLQQIGDPGRN